MLYVFFRFLFRILFRFVYRYEVIGRENVPSTGAVLLCSNHINNLDPPILGSSLDRKVSYMAKKELFDVPVLSFLITRFGAFPVKRGGQDKQAMRTTLSLLKEENVVGIFPEGTRSKTGKLGKAFPGVGLFALKETATVIPVAIIGPYLPFTRVKVIFGSAVNMKDLKQEKVTSEATKIATDRIMTHIQALLDQHNQSNRL
jgi:1-acyl-sn-glycerol-3-phosphate acyltransferase